MKIKKGDTVKVISGKDKGKSGTILHAFPRENKVVIEGIALYKRHLKGVAGKVGRIVERPRAIDASNVQKVESASKKKKEALLAVK